MVYEDVLPRLGVGKDVLPAGRVDVAVRGEDERAARLAQVFAVLVKEGPVRGRRSTDEDLCRKSVSPRKPI